MLNAYKSTSPWSGFGTILPLTASGIDNIVTDVDAIFDVYNLHGILIKKDCGCDYLKSLSTGTYILRQGNVNKKMIIR
ncbi:MAG: hypothetical protein K2J86_06225 [Prevotella sp.]|nr:hypothetical protein [Prevotella sp.]